MKKFILFVFAVTTLLSLTLSVSAINIYEEFEKAEFTNEDAVLPYRIFIPEDYSEGKKYPMMVFLHGAGERGNDNEAQLKNALGTLFNRDDGLMLNTIVIAPQCPKDNQWVDTPWADGNYSIDEVPESNELKAVVALTEEICESYSVDRTRIYVSGVSMGGFGTWDLITRHNDIYAAAAPMCGGGDPSKAELLADTMIYTFHGTEDTSVPYSGTAEMVSAIEETGSRLISFVSYKGEGHVIWEMASDEAGWLEWLYEQKLSDRYPDKLEAEDTEAIPEDTMSGWNFVVTAEETESNVAESQASNSEETVNESSNDGSSFPVIYIIVAVVAIIVFAVAAVIGFKLKKK